MTIAVKFESQVIKTSFSPLFIYKTVLQLSITLEDE